jgi:hypothetical protein
MKVFYIVTECKPILLPSVSIMIAMQPCCELISVLGKKCCCLLIQLYLKYFERQGFHTPSVEDDL